MNGPFVQLDRRAAAAHGLDPRCRLRPGAVIQLDAGPALLVRPDGGFDYWPPMGRRSIASDPAPWANPSPRRRS